MTDRTYENLYIAGKWVSPSSSERYEVVSPASEETIGRLPLAAKEDVDRAVAAAREAFDRGPWPRMSPAERIEVVRKLGSLYEKEEDAFVQTITDEMGCPITQSHWMQFGVPLAMFEAYAQVAESFPFETERRYGASRALVTREPVGVVAAVVPWNVPQMTAIQKVAPALLAGCSVILKTSPETSLDSYILADLITQAGIPEGVVSILPADRAVSEYLVTRPDVDKVTFTGSTMAGRRIASLCGNDLRRVTLELGGKSAAIFLEDADFESGIETLRRQSLRNSGQICSLKTRLVVPRSRHEEFVDGLIGLMDSMPVGDPTDPETQIGPMVTSTHRERVEGYLQSGKDEGAVVVRGGGRPANLKRGWFVEPTIFTGVTSQMRIAQEEIFGPALAVFSYDTEAEAIAIANDSHYGLNGAVYTRDLAHGFDVAARLRTGVVELNGNTIGLTAPAGGFKSSGIGREAGPEGLAGYTELKSIGLPAEFEHAAKFEDSAA
ncbi:aldehyde dehydrogenase [Microbacterium sp. F51-2R]|uniref:aldehyde dehydrogenase n=1 Tax=Microbacterium sp. F51-2R TaxID=3445777 RepID=UPI003FA11269